MKNRKKIWHRGMAAVLVGVMAFSLAGCKSGEEDISSEPEKEFVYVPEYIEMGQEVDYLNNMFLDGNTLYYSTYVYNEAEQTGGEHLYAKDLGSSEAPSEIPVDLSGLGNVMSMRLDGEQNVYLISADYDNGQVGPEGFPIPVYSLIKKDSQGTELYRQDITEIVNKNQDDNYIQYMIIDNEGRVYAATQYSVHLFAADGTYQGTVEGAQDSWMQSLALGKDGKVYAYRNGMEDMELVEVDFAGKTFGKIYGNVPNGNNGIQQGIEKDFLMCDNYYVYEYDLATQTYETLFSWLDSDINGDYVQFVAGTGDGKLLAVMRNWSDEQAGVEIARLTKTPYASLPQKEEITIGVLTSSQDLQAAAVNFNKKNEKYRIQIKEYIDRNNWTETSWQDGITRLNNDITSKNCPDLLDLSGLNIKQLVSKGVLEDLRPFLAESSAISEDDFLKSVLDGYTMDGILTCIPNQFSIQSVVGRTSQVGDKMGWTLEQLIAMADENPDAEILPYASKAEMLRYCISYNQDLFIDWSKGECHFDSEEFKTVLEYANRFPLEVQWNEGDKSFPRKIQDGEVLLNTVYLSDSSELQVNEAMFGEEITFIGYPTVDGSAGNFLFGENCFGIAAKSSNKEGAWEFVESLLGKTENSRHSWGFPSRQDMLDEMFAEEMKAEYAVDENGETLLDENGAPIVISNHSYGWDDWECDIFPATQEQVDLLKEVIASAKVSSQGSDEIMNIIMEETEGYFQGQKTVDEVMKVIQSRVQIYVSENS